MFSLYEQERSLTVVFSGRLDTSECLEADARLEAAVGAAGGSVEFDLGGVDYVASLFLRICVRTARQVGPGRFSIVNVGPSVKKVFKIAGLDEYLRVES
jgi:anti-anti-sigma factor